MRSPPPNVDRMKRVVGGIVSTVVLLSGGVALAGGEWDHSGGTEGRFGSAEAACRDLIGTGGAYEFADAIPATQPGYMTCRVKAKDSGNSKDKPTLIEQGVVYKVDKPQPAPSSSSKGPSTSAAGASSGSKAASAAEPPKGCDAKSDWSWFPTIQKSTLASAATGPDGDVVPDASTGACFVSSERTGRRLFVNSNQTLRPDRVRKVGIPNHLHLRVNGLIVDTTIFQFFNVKNGFQGLVFVGTEAQLASTLDKLVAQCGPSEVPGMKSAVAGKSGAQLKAMLWDGAIVANAGSTLEMRKDGKGAQYK